MTQLIAHDADGRIHFICERADDMGPMQPDGYIYRAWGEPFSLIPKTPTSEARWLNDRPQWVETATLDQARTQAWAAVKIDRDKAEAAPFEFEGGLYDPNKENVSGAALAALLAQLGGLEVSRTWTLADNSRRVLTGAQIIAMGLALTTRVDAIHERGRMLRDLINNATTPAGAYGYTWNSLDV
jgi:hypothetical protein